MARAGAVLHVLLSELTKSFNSIIKLNLLHFYCHCALYSNLEP